jgi:1-deoxy-D-xylulose-5-phosphate reductoisomerase
LALAYHAMESGGNMPCIVNAANEVVVAEFLKDNIGFLQMSEVIETCMAKIGFIYDPSLDDYFETDTQTRIFAQQLVNSI